MGSSQPDLPVQCFVISTQTHHGGPMAEARLVAEQVIGLKIGSCRTIGGLEYIVVSVVSYQNLAGWYFHFVLKNDLKYWEEISSEAETKNTKAGSSTDRH